MNRFRISVGTAAVMLACSISFAALAHMVHKGPAGNSSGPPRVHMHSERAATDVTLLPARGNMVSALINVLRDDSPLDAKEVRLALSNIDANVMPIDRSATRVGRGQWIVEHLDLQAGGVWEVQVYVAADDFEVVFNDEIDLSTRH